jgi:putative sigma-54 modulation protein
MHIYVTFRHIDSSEELKAYAETKFQRFSMYLHEPIEVHVVMEVQKIHQMAEVTVTAKNFHFHGVESSESFHASINLLEAKVERHIKKHKEKIKDHKHLS